MGKVPTDKMTQSLQEMMYVWNGFTIVGKRADLTESLLVTIESAEEKLRSDPRETITLLLRR